MFLPGYHGLGEHAKYTMKQPSTATLVLHGKESEQQRHWTLDTPMLTLGRDDDNDIVLPDRKVSRRHAVIRVERGRWVFEDQDSRNGTFINGHQLREPWFLSDGEVIHVANKFSLTFIDSEITMPATMLTQAGGEMTQSGSFVVGGGTKKPKLFDGPPPSSYRLTLEHKARRIWVGGTELHPPLSASQYALLEVLYDHIGEVVSREVIASRIWPKASGIVSEQAIDSLVWRLRKRIAKLDPDNEYITTVRGHGIRMETVPAESP